VRRRVENLSAAHPTDLCVASGGRPESAAARRGCGNGARRRGRDSTGRRRQGQHCRFSSVVVERCGGAVGI
jgi:hypothetical protein